MGKREEQQFDENRQGQDSQAKIADLCIQKLKCEINRFCQEVKPTPVNGKFKVPDLPGIGIELNDELVKRSPNVTVR